MTARASILVLTHDRSIVLRQSVASALAQTVAEVEVLIVGDGVTAATRSAALELSADSRVRFLDFPKGEHRGEVHRDTAVREAASNAIFYLCDDDLLLPTHVESLLELLQTRNFVQSKNCWVDDVGRIRPFVADLSSADTIAWHLSDDFRHNAVSITGTAHARDFYLDAQQPWTVTPTGWWPDHYQWRKLFAQPNFSGATSKTVTALQFPVTETHRAHWTETEQLAELEQWLHTIARNGAGEYIEALYQSGLSYHMEVATIVQYSPNAETDRLRAEYAQLLGSRSWKLTAPLRRARTVWLRRGDRKK